MNHKDQLIIFGEVLFDCFPGGEQVLGGAPFNVAWHLQALGDLPRFISRVGDDQLGTKIINAMTTWGMALDSLQIDTQHPTGHVEIALIDNEPHYTITPDCAYDFIDASEIKKPESNGILYHGSLALRNSTTRDAYEKLASNPALSIFLDVNLRSPWWHKEEVSGWLQRARWVKLNQDELQQLGTSGSNEIKATSAAIQQDMHRFQEEYALDLLIVTQGDKGAIVRTRQGELHSVAPAEITRFVDSVGAGDAFTAVFLHGLISEWPLIDILKTAQQFASRVVGLRGATSNDAAIYEDFIRT